MFFSFTQGMRFFLLLIAGVIVSYTAAAQQGYVTDSVGKKIYGIEGATILDAAGNIIYTVRGNLVFEGTSEKKKDIVLAIGSENILGSKGGKILTGNMKETLLGVHDGKFYFESMPTDDDRFMVGYYQTTEGSFQSVYDHSGEPIADIYGEAISNGQLGAIFYLLYNQYNLDAPVREVLADLNVNNGTGQGTIKRLWSTGDDEFIWDGHMLKRRFNSFDYEEWSFDGRVLKRLWYEGGVEYEWDGSTLRQRWSTGDGTLEEFTWDGRVLRRRWNTGNDEFIIQGNIVKRMWDTGNDEWEIDGDIPIPVIALVVFGLMRK